MRRSPSPQVLIDAGPKCLIKLPAKTSNGLDTYFVHYYEVNDAGKILKFMALDDGAGLQVPRGHDGGGARELRAKEGVSKPVPVPPLWSKPLSSLPPP